MFYRRAARGAGDGRIATVASRIFHHGSPDVGLDSILRPDPFLTRSGQPPGSGPAEEQIMAKGVGWFEIGGTDFDALKSFYSDLFDWKLNDVSNDGMKYAMFQGEGDAIGGGLFGGEAKGPLVYIAVDDVDASLGQITTKGGEVV